jgi:BTB/POZ domain
VILLNEMQLRCTFENDLRSVFRYRCVVNKSNITQRCEIDEFVGQHIERRSNEDVEVLQFEMALVHYLPSGIQKHFPNLKRLEVHGCQLREMSSQDLEGLENLEELSLIWNNLKTLPDDLFINTRRLQHVDLLMNQTEYLSSRLLDPIPDHQWKVINLQNNKSIDAFYDPQNLKAGFLDIEKSFYSVKKLKSFIDYSCIPPNPCVNTLFASTLSLKESPGTAVQQVQSPAKASVIINNFKKVWELKELSDFTIVVGNKEIRVHKTVLAVQSPVFAGLFKTDQQIMASGKIKIKDCSEAVADEFFRAVYTGEVGNVAAGNVLNLLSLACTFKVEELRALYESIAINNLSEHNALEALKRGNLDKSEKLIDAAFNMIKKKYRSCIKADFLKNKPDQVEEIINAANAYKELVERLNRQP